MAQKTIGYIFIVLGVVIAGISLAADVLGIGRYPGIHYAQLIGAAVGVVISLVGVWLALRKPIQKK